jgi:hypothetical protein
MYKACSVCGREIHPLGFASHRAMHIRVEKKRRARLVDSFNQLYPVSSTVFIREEIGGDFEAATVHNVAWLEKGKPVCVFEQNGFSIIRSIETDFVLYK